MKQLSSKKQESVVQKKAEKTLLEHIESIVELVENSNLNEEFYKKAKKNISYVSKKMGLTPNQAVIFAIFIENSADCRIRISGLAKTIGCRLTRI